MPLGMTLLEIAGRRQTRLFPVQHERGILNMNRPLNASLSHLLISPSHSGQQLIGLDAQWLKVPGQTLLKAKIRMGGRLENGKKPQRQPSRKSNVHLERDPPLMPETKS